MKYKTCSKCKKIKPVSEFTFTGGKYYSQCKQCKNKATAEYRKNNPDYEKRRKDQDLERKEYFKEYAAARRQDPEFIHKNKQYMKDYHKRVDSTQKARDRRKDPAVREKERVAAERYRKNNPDKMKEIHRRHNEKRRKTQKYKDFRNNYEKEKRDNDTEYRILVSCRSKINKALSKKNNTSRELLGCEIDYLIEYLGRLFDDNMTWENYGSYWHIDHIVPCNYFDFSKDNDIKICFNYRNLQPLSAAENCSKQDKLPNDYKEIILSIKKALHLEG